MPYQVRRDEQKTRAFFALKRKDFGQCPVKDLFPGNRYFLLVSDIHYCEHGWSHKHRNRISMFIYFVYKCFGAVSFSWSSIWFPECVESSAASLVTLESTLFVIRYRKYQSNAADFIQTQQSSFKHSRSHLNALYIYWIISLKKWGRPRETVMRHQSVENYAFRQVFFAWSCCVIVLGELFCLHLRR